MEIFGVLLVVGVACLVITGLLAVVRPIENWRQVGLRLLWVGLALSLAGLVLRSLS